MIKKVTLMFLSIASLFVFVVPAFAHVVVKPNTAEIAAWQTFTVGVPNEKDNPTIALKLLIPDGLNHVSPNVKPGWTIEIKKTGEGEDAKVTEIDWTDGSIPVGQRDDFFFSAQVPSSETAISWKAYQTYANGEVVSWDQDPAAMKDMSDEQKETNEKKGLGPYSQTKIVNNLTGSTNTTPSGMIENAKNIKIAFALSLGAIMLSALTFGIALRKRS